jgi:hypothetical protein
MYPVIQRLNKKFQNLHLLKRNTLWQMSPWLWKCCVSDNIYPLKIAKFGTKMYENHEPSCSNVWPALIYTGQGTELKNQFVTGETNTTAATVVNLLEHLLGHGNTVWRDNFYISPLPAQFMKYNKTYCVGTSHTNRKKCSSYREEQDI